MRPTSVLTEKLTVLVARITVCAVTFVVGTCTLIFASMGVADILLENLPARRISRDMSIRERVMALAYLSSSNVRPGHSFSGPLTRYFSIFYMSLWMQLRKLFNLEVDNAKMLLTEKLTVLVARL